VLAGIGSVAVAWSGGTDSSLLAKVARDVLGRDGAAAFTAVSPSLPADELDDCRSLALEWDLAWQVLHTDELDRPEYRRNAADRCAHCKHALLDVMGPISRASGATMCLGVIVDDLGDDRPGQVVAAERGARFPLVEAGLDKAAVRRISKELGMRTWDKPAAACLASRIPHGTEVTVTLLGRVEKAEKALRELGFGLTEPLRVRHRGDRARVELAGAELARALADPAPVTAAVSAAGYQEVELAPEGYRSPA
jgi:pyridinium-3,5-biscarboxylic acid mononucleotide sulfurtransferase